MTEEKTKGVHAVKDRKTGKIRPDTWRLRVYVGRTPQGTPQQAQEIFHGTEAAAKKRHRKMVTQAERGALTVNRHTLGSLIDDYIAHAESLGRSPTTIREYRRIAARTIPASLLKPKLAKLRTKDLDNLYASLTAKGNAPSTVRRVHALITASLHQAEKWNYVDTNVAKKSTPPPVRYAEPKAPTAEEVMDIIDQAAIIDPKMGDLFILAALTGARRGELVGLRWSDWDRDAGTLRIERSIYELAGGWDVKGVKNHAGRTVTLDVSALEALDRRWAAATALADELKLELPDGGYIFTTSPTGTTPVLPDRASKAFASAAKAVGVDAHLHLFRHWAATQMIGGGTPITVAAKRLGHRDSSVTLRVYSHALPQQDAAAATMLGDALRRKELPA